MPFGLSLLPSETIERVHGIVEACGKDHNLDIDISAKSDVSQRAMTLHLMKHLINSPESISSLFVSVPIPK
jgi:hypothetical protein